MRWLILSLIILVGIIGLSGEPTVTAPAQQKPKPQIVTQLGHAGGILSVVFSRDGKLALSGSGDKTLKLWDIASRREIRTFVGHKYEITSVAFSPSGKMALSGGGAPGGAPA